MKCVFFHYSHSMTRTDFLFGRHSWLYWWVSECNFLCLRQYTSVTVTVSALWGQVCWFCQNTRNQSKMVQAIGGILPAIFGFLSNMPAHRLCLLNLLFYLLLLMVPLHMHFTTRGSSTRCFPFWSQHLPPFPPDFIRPFTDCSGGPVWIYSTPWYTLHLPRENAWAGATVPPSLYSPCSC